MLILDHILTSIVCWRPTGQPWGPRWSQAVGITGDSTREKLGSPHREIVVLFLKRGNRYRTIKELQTTVTLWISTHTSRSTATRNDPSLQNILPLPLYSHSLHTIDFGQSLEVNI